MHVLEGLTTFSCITNASSCYNFESDLDVYILLLLLIRKQEELLEIVITIILLEELKVKKCQNQQLTI